MEWTLSLDLETFQAFAGLFHNQKVGFKDAETVYTHSWTLWQGLIVR